MKKKSKKEPKITVMIDDDDLGFGGQSMSETDVIECELISKKTICETTTLEEQEKFLEEAKRILSESDKLKIRGETYMNYIATHPYVHESIQEKLAKNHDSRIREKLACNHHLNYSLLYKLAEEDNDDRVKIAALKNIIQFMEEKLIKKK